MTPEQRAKELLSKPVTGFFRDRIADAIRDAAAEEREACAKVAMKVGPGATDPDGCWHDIAAAIRSRQEGEP